MAGVTDPAFRRRLRRAGCRYLFTEMVSAAAVARRNRRTLAYLHASDRGPDLAAQVFGSRPDELAEAARAAAEAGFSHLDLNMGCPVRKVVRSGAGAALMRDPGLAAACVRALRRAFPGTLSVKIRSGWDAGRRNAAEIAALAEAEGADLVIVHPRTRAQGYAGEADWSVVGEVAARVGVPVVG
ncbi:MAG: tRNA-dihydrouridine synthase family protein, partial [Candidatus Dadabacteria bacterium]